MAQTLLLICSPLPGHQSPLKLPLDCDKVKWPFTSVQKLVPTITESPGGQWKWWVAQYSGINCRLKSNVSKEHWKMSEHGLRTLKAPPHRSNSSLAIAHHWERREEHSYTSSTKVKSWNLLLRVLLSHQKRKPCLAGVNSSDWVSLRHQTEEAISFTTTAATSSTDAGPLPKSVMRPALSHQLLPGNFEWGWGPGYPHKSQERIHSGSPGSLLVQLALHYCLPFFHHVAAGRKLELLRNLWYWPVPPLLNIPHLGLLASHEHHDSQLSPAPSLPPPCCLWRGSQNHSSEEMPVGWSSDSD